MFDPIDRLIQFLKKGIRPVQADDIDIEVEYFPEQIYFQLQAFVKVLINGRVEMYADTVAQFADKLYIFKILRREDIVEIGTQEKEISRLYTQF